MKQTLLATVLLGIAVLTAPAMGQTVTITQSATSPGTYDNLLTFDAPGDATGGGAPDFSGLPGDSWQADYGTSFAANLIVVEPVGMANMDGNVLNGYFFGLTMTFDEPVTAASFQMWHGNNNAIVASSGGVPIYDNYWAGTPAFGAFGDSWFNVQAAPGETFDSIRIIDGSGAGDFLYVDNISWTPEPATLALLGIGGLMVGRRRC